MVRQCPNDDCVSKRICRTDTTAHIIRKLSTLACRHVLSAERRGLLRMRLIPKTKLCRGCRRNPLLTEFARCQANRDGLQSRCKKCNSKDVMATRDPKKRRVYHKRYWAKHSERICVQQKGMRDKLRSEFIAAYGGRCVCCGEDEPLFLTLEHVGGGGTQHRKKYGSYLYGHLKKLGWPKDKFTLLCYNCNCVQKHGIVCPHQLKREITK